MLKYATCVFCILLLSGCNPSESDNTGKPNKFENSFNSVFFDTSYSNYAAYKLGESEWHQLIPSIHTIQVDESKTNLDLVQECGKEPSVLSYRKLYVKSDAEIDELMCQIFHNMAITEETDLNSDEPNYAIIESASSDYEILHGDSSSQYNVFSVNGVFKLSLDKLEESHSLALLLKRKSDSSYHLYFEKNILLNSGKVFEFETQIGVNTFPLNINYSNTVESGQFLPTVVINNAIEVDLLSTLDEPTNFYFTLMHSNSVTPFEYHYGHTFQPSQNLMVFRYEDHIVDPDAYLSSIPEDIDWSPYPLSEKTIYLPEYDFSQLLSDTTSDIFWVGWMKLFKETNKSDGSSILFEVDSKRLREPNTVEMPDLNALPNFIYDPDEFTYLPGSVMREISNEKGIEPGSIKIRIHKYFDIR